MGEVVILNGSFAKSIRLMLNKQNLRKIVLMLILHVLNGLTEGMYRSVSSNDNALSADSHQTVSHRNGFAAHHNVNFAFHLLHGHVWLDEDALDDHLHSFHRRETLKSEI